MQFQVQVWVKMLKLLGDHSPIFEPIEQCFYSSQVILELQINKNCQIKYFNLLANLSYKSNSLEITVFKATSYSAGPKAENSLR